MAKDGKDRTKPHVSERTRECLGVLRLKEQRLIDLLTNPAYAGKQEKAGLDAGYRDKKIVSRKMHDPRFVRALSAMKADIAKQHMAENAVMKQQIMDALAQDALNPKVSPRDRAVVAKTWGEFEGSVGTGGNVTHVNVHQTGSGNGQDAEPLETALDRIAQLRRRDRALGQ